MCQQIWLIGDSIFDNGAYVGPNEFDVRTHLSRRLETCDWSVDLRAVDGAVTRDVHKQLGTIPDRDKVVMVLSVGGNDALSLMPLLAEETTATFARMLVELERQTRTFRKEYAALIRRIITIEMPLIVCTIYNPCFDDEDLQNASLAGLSLFNDVIMTEAIAHNLPIIDLRRVCETSVCFANPIEPSHEGGARIADAIMQKIRGFECINFG